MKNKRKRPYPAYRQDFSGESKTQQHFKDSADVNNIIAHFRATGIDPYAERAKNQNFGYASSQKFSDAMNNIAEINSAFQELTATERADHQNDPALWLETLATPPPTSHSKDDAAIASPSETQDVETSEIVPLEPKSGED